MNATIRKFTFAPAALLFVAPLFAQDPRLAKIEAMFRRFDADGDQVISRAESKSEELFKRCDVDKNGAVTVAEMIKADGVPLDRIVRMRLLGQTPEVESFAQLDRCDADGDGALDYDELLVLVFSVCDRGMRDKKLDVKEAAYSPVPAKAAFKTGWLAREFKQADRDQDGFLLMRDLTLPEGYLKLLDRNGDGRASFDELVADEIVRQGGYVAKFAETAAYFAKHELARAADWPGDSDGFRRVDENKDGTVSAPEFDRHARRTRTTLSRASDFTLRFDLDGDAKVARAEFGGSELIFARLDVDGDGFITAKDRPKR